MDKDKKRLKILLIEMLKATKNNNREIVDELKEEFGKLFDQVFHKILTEESLPYDRARNNILMSFSEPIKEKQKQEFLMQAEMYINQIKLSLQKR